jgi:hypothetical protein
MNYITHKDEVTKIIEWLTNNIKTNNLIPATEITFTTLGLFNDEIKWEVFQHLLFKPKYAGVSWMKIGISDAELATLFRLKFT